MEEKIAIDGKIDKAISAFQKALELDPSLELDPRTKAQEIATPQ